MLTGALGYQCYETLLTRYRKKKSCKGSRKNECKVKITEYFLCCATNNCILFGSADDTW